MLRGWGRDARLRVVVCLLMCPCNPARQLQQAKGENNASSTKSQLSSTTPHTSAPYLTLFNRQATSICVHFLNLYFLACYKMCVLISQVLFGD